LYNHSLAPRALHTDAGIEAAFLQMYKAWESLQEECTIAFMAGRLRADGKQVPCGVIAQSEHIARALIYQDRQYTLWTNIDEVMERWDRIFRNPNLLASAVRPATTELRQMTTVRNAIAHSSIAAETKFYKLVQGHLGGKPAVFRPAVFLASPYPGDRLRTHFDRYADVLETAGVNITG
jgi:hypothetical protein